MQSSQNLPIWLWKAILFPAILAKWAISIRYGNGGNAGKLCVCGLPDGRVVIKKLAKSREKGLFILHSQFEPPIYDVAVIWAAKVKNMVPR
jgi:hypothetical protein